MKRQMRAALNRARKIAGDRRGSALAKELGISRQAVYKWQICPITRALDVERITGVSRYELRPDIYGEEN